MRAARSNLSIQCGVGKTGFHSLSMDIRHSRSIHPFQSQWLATPSTYPRRVIDLLTLYPEEQLIIYSLPCRAPQGLMNVAFRASHL